MPNTLKSIYANSPNWPDYCFLCVFLCLFDQWRWGMSLPPLDLRWLIALWSRWAHLMDRVSNPFLEISKKQLKCFDCFESSLLNLFLSLYWIRCRRKCWGRQTGARNCSSIPHRRGWAHSDRLQRTNSVRHQGTCMWDTLYVAVFITVTLLLSRSLSYEMLILSWVLLSLLSL